MRTEQVPARPARRCTYVADACPPFFFCASRMRRTVAFCAAVSVDGPAASLVSRMPSSNVLWPCVLLLEKWIWTRLAETTHLPTSSHRPRRTAATLPPDHLRGRVEEARLRERHPPARHVEPGRGDGLNLCTAPELCFACRLISQYSVSKEASNLPSEINLVSRIHVHA